MTGRNPLFLGISLFLGGLGIGWVLSLQAEVTSADVNGFNSQIDLRIEAPPARVYRALVYEVSEWWDASHSYSGDAANFYMEDRPGGCFCEKFPEGGGVEHMRVLFLQKDKQVRLEGGLGPLQPLSVSGTMDFLLADDEDMSTLLTYNYRVVGHLEGGLDAWAEGVDLVQRGQLLRLKEYVESIQPN